MYGVNLTALMEMNSVDRLYLGLGLLTSLASLLACVTLFFVVCCIPAIRNKARYIVLFIVIANAGASIGTVVSVIVKVGYPVVSWRSHPACESAAALTVLFRISGYLWTVTLALFLCLEAWKKNLNFTSSLILWPAHCVCWGFPGESMMSFFIYDMLLNSIYMQFNKHSNSYGWLIFWLIQILKDIFTFLFNYGSLTLSN